MRTCAAPAQTPRCGTSDFGPQSRAPASIPSRDGNDCRAFLLHDEPRSLQQAIKRDCWGCEVRHVPPTPSRVQPSAAFILVHELSREIIGKGSYLGRGSTAARVDGM